MSYTDDLTFQLRLRNVDEALVTDVVAEVEEHIATGGDPTEFFGAPDRYAAQFPAGPRRKSHTVPIYVGAGCAVAWIALSLALYATTVWERSASIDRVVLLPALGILVLGLLTSFVVRTIAASRPVAGKR